MRAANRIETESERAEGEEGRFGAEEGPGGAGLGELLLERKEIEGGGGDACGSFADGAAAA